MAIVKTNWQSFLSPDSDLPPDVTFLVKSEDDESQSKTFVGHRYLLGGISPVFRGMFFGPMKETGEVVEVKETTPEAFSTMINFIYMSPEESFNLDNITSCPQKLFELLALADRYQILDLKTLATEALSNLALTRENMIFTATVAKHYKPAFEDVSTRLMVKCLKFLYDTTTGVGDIGALIRETEQSFPGASLDILRELISAGNETLQLPGIFAIRCL